MSEQILQNAWRLHQAGNLNEAARLYQDVLRTNPRNFNALQLLGFVHFQRGEFEDAEGIMEKAIRINPSSVDALYNRGCALQALDRLKEALQCFGKALTVKPDFVSICPRWLSCSLRKPSWGWLWAWRSWCCSRACNWPGRLPAR